MFNQKTKVMIKLKNTFKVFLALNIYTVLFVVISLSIISFIEWENIFVLDENATFKPLRILELCYFSVSALIGYVSDKDFSYKRIFLYMLTGETNG
jgi:hypothetical protein